MSRGGLGLRGRAQQVAHLADRHRQRRRVEHAAHAQIQDVQRIELELTRAAIDVFCRFATSNTSRMSLLRSTVCIRSQMIPTPA